MRRFPGWFVFVALIVLSGVEVRLAARNARAATLCGFTESAGPGFRDVEVTVAAYCPCRRCCGRAADGRYCTGRRVSPTDYSFAVSPDLEPYLPIDRATLFVPGYNRPGTMSTARDRTRRDRRMQIEILMTVTKDGKSAHRRALEWGVRTLVIRIER